MNTTMDINNKLHNLELANNNFKSIIIKPNNEKFDYLDSWLSKTSILFKRENENIEKKLYPKFKCGTIVKVDFGINRGTELSNQHFAIVINKYDSIKNESITVIPLTSKYNKYSINIGRLIFNEVIKKLNASIEENNNKLKTTKNRIEINKIKEINEILNNEIRYYSKYDKISYVRVNQISTISKSKIIRQRNQYDLISKVVCPREIMQNIKKSISEKFI